MEPLSNVTGHHQRANAIRKFIAKPPARGQRLRLAVLGADGMAVQTLGEWLRSEAEGSNAGPLSHEISEKVQEHSNVIKRSVEAILAWLPGAEDGDKVVTSKTLRARPVLDGEDEEENFALGIDGSGHGLVIQMQRHHEAMARSYFTAHQAQISTANQLAIASMERVVELQRQNDELTDKYANALLTNVQLAASVGAENEDGDPEDGNGPKTDEARAELIKRKTALIDQFMTVAKAGGPMVMQSILAWAQQQAAAKKGAA